MRPIRCTTALLLLGCGLLLLALQPGCPAAPPPRPVLQQPALPPLPVEPIPKAEYLRSAVSFDVDEVFVGTPQFRSVLHWLVSGKLQNLGNRTITWVEVLFRFEETGHLEKVVIFDTFQDQTPLPPRESRVVHVAAARLAEGVVGNIDPTKVSSLPPPHVTAQVTDLHFADENPAP